MQKTVLLRENNQNRQIPPQLVQQEQEVFNRPPRIVIAPPQEKIDIPKPPVRENLPPPPGLILLLMPVLTVGIMFSVYIFVNHASWSQMTMLLPMAVFSIMSPVSSIVTTQQRAKVIRNRNQTQETKYQQVLAAIRTQLSNAVEEQRRIALSTNPPPLDLEAQIVERARLWERRPEDDDFLSVRVGCGQRPLSVVLNFPEVDVTNPLLTTIQQVREEFRSVDKMPCCLSLTKVKSLGITGRRQGVAALSREVLCQLATHHSPEDVRILAIYPASQRQDWDWVRNLPHTAPIKGFRRDRLTAVGENEADELLNSLLEELSQRASKNTEHTELANAVAPTQSIALPHLVVIVHDYVEVRKHPALTHAFKLGEQLGVSIIYLVAQEQAIPSECRGVLRLADDGTLSYAVTGTDGEMFENVVADLIDLEHAQSVSCVLHPLQIAGEEEDAADLPTNVRFLDLADLPYADTFDPRQWWGNGSQPRFGRLRVPIGMGMNGPVWLDLNDSVHGPHGIIAGTTGAGKSELLQSIIVGFAMTHHPHMVNFVLVDFKGGAAFKPFEKIPHTVGMVTDLSGKLTERALLALKSELKRREHVLSQANAKKIVDYQMMHIQNPDVYEPLPNLLIIIDEFAELAKEHPLFMEGLVSVVQKGRSLGVHLILATQKPTGSVNPNIWSNLKFRICLRVASLNDSRDMLGRSEAALLPSTVPGRAYFQIGSEIFELFQSARISQTARVSDETMLAVKQHTSNGEITDQKVLVDIIEPYQATLGEQLFKPWPAPLPYRISLQEVQRHVSRRRTPATAGKIPPYGWLTFPMGLIDLPMQQRQEPWLLDMPAQGGHVLIAGASGTGKSVFLRTLITSLAYTHSPTQLHLYLVDCGGQALRVFEKLPHVGGVFGESDEEYIRRLLRKLSGIVDERKQYCMRHQIEDFLMYQRRRLEDSTLPEMPAVLLIIDKFVEFKQIHEKEMDTLLAIARHGRTYGVFLVLSADRPATLPMQLLSLIEMRIGLRLVELSDSLILLGKNDAAAIDPHLPGRGYKRGKVLEEIHFALPTTGDDDDEQTRQLDEMVTTMSRAGRLPASLQAPAIKLLPEYVRADYFLMDAISTNSIECIDDTAARRGKGRETTKNEPASPQALRIRLGIEDFSLRPVALKLNADTPHMLVTGGPGSGRTAVLQTCLLMLASPENSHANVILVDFRRSSRPLRRLANVRAYIDTEERLIEAVTDLKKELKARVVQLQEELDRQQDDDEEPLGASMTPIVLVIDDYEQLSALTKNPLNDLREFLLKARDLHLHIIVSGPPS